MFCGSFDGGIGGGTMGFLDDDPGYLNAMSIVVRRAGGRRRRGLSSLSTMFARPFSGRDMRGRHQTR